MSLENLEKIGQLKRHQTSAAEVAELLAAAARNLRDATVLEVSAETRFDCAYKAIMQAALVAMMANGYRPSTNTPGHHQTLVQALTSTIGLESKRMLVLDSLRRKRNLADYVGSDLDEDSVETCLVEARALTKRVQAWLRDNRADLLP